MTDDAQLLRQYAEAGSEPAFAEFVARHVGLVYAAARRRTNDDTHARDVAQAVFTEAARRADVLARHASPAGWLYTATRNASLNLLRADRRRQRREQVAHDLIAMSPSDPADWDRLRPVLDAAMDELPGSDREAVLERFFENRPYSDIGARLRVSENAARMRVDRALDRLRQGLARRGVTSTGSALAILLSEQAVAAPTGLAAGITQAAIAGNVGAAATAGWLAFFTMNKATTALATLVLIGALVPPALELRARQVLGSEIERLNREHAALAVETAEVDAAFQHVAPAAPDQERRAELEALRKRAALLKARPDGVLDSELRAPQNAGMATPEATFETINWAINTQDWETFSRTFVVEGDARARLEAFFAGVRPEVQEKYGTPERLLAHAWISGTTPHGSAWMQGMQVLESQPVDGGPATRRVKIWQRTGTGLETSNIAEFQYRPAQGWLVSPGATAKALQFILPQLDPQTGEFVKKPSAPR